MMRKRLMGIMLLAASVHGAAALTSAATDPLDTAGAEDARAGSPAASAVWTKPAAPAQVVTAPAAPAPPPERPLSANPLWGIPLTALSGTRDRPIFSSSRRPPAPAVAPAAVPKVVAAAKPREPERPPLSLVGTIASGDEGFRDISGPIDQGRTPSEDRRGLSGLEAAIGSRPGSDLGEKSTGRHPRIAAARSGTSGDVRPAMKISLRRRTPESCCR